jgi:adenosine deaminase
MMVPIPNAELHLHVDGCLESELLVEIARRNHIALPTYDPAELDARYIFGDLQAFLDVHYSNLAVLRTEQDFYDLGRLYLRRAHEAGVLRAEAFFDTTVHMVRGVPLAAVIRGYGEAFAEARRDGYSCDLILSFQREHGGEVATEVLAAALPYRDLFFGVGLDSTEIGYPPSLFVEVYARARAEGLRLVAHAGEEGGPDYVREALDLLHVERVDHGLRAMEDPDLIKRLADEQVALTVCPLSNVALKAVPTMARHPVFAMLEAGIRVTVSSDDPPYFGGHVDQNYKALVAAGATAAQLEQLARNSFDAAFISDAEHSSHLAALAAWSAGPRAGDRGVTG